MQSPAHRLHSFPSPNPLFPPPLVSHDSSPPSSAPSALTRRRKDRACDACRRRKTKCDGPFIPSNRCTSCTQSNKPCTYVEISQPRGPPKAYITSLEDRMEQLEALLEQIHPGVDFSDQLGPPVIRDSWKSTQNNPAISASPVSLNFHRPDLSRKRSLPSHLSLPSISGSISPQVTSGIKRPRSRKSEPRLSALYLKGDVSDNVSSGEDSIPDSDTENLSVTGVYGGVTKLTHVTSEKHELSEPNGNRFHGRSSTMNLVEVTRQLKSMHLKEALNPSISSAQNQVSPMPSRRPEFWESPPWEQLYEGHHIDSPTIIPSILEHFPPHDLAEVLINLFFLHVNNQFPLLHRPTFIRQWREKLHHRDIWFADVCLSLFSVASRWCDDTRILPEGSTIDYGEPDWTLAGWRYYEPAIGVHRLRRSLLYPVTLFEIQTFTLLAMFIRGTQSYPSAWIFVNVGLRKAQDVGAHRRKVYHESPNVEDELWKRAFWHLVIFDRLGSMSLGRACSIQEEDFDLDLPLEVDDEYWELAFKQPPERPSKIAAFNEFIKLTQLMAFTMKTLYCIDQAKVFGSLFTGDWQEKVVSELTHALQKWIKEVPKHLRWSENMQDPVFAGQSATIFAAYYLTEILIYRPFIPVQRISSSHTPLFSLSALDVCIKAARATARIIKADMERGPGNISNAIAVSYVSAGLLLLKIWEMKIWEKTQSLKPEFNDMKPPLAYQIDDLTNDVKIFVNALECARPRWSIVHGYLGKLQELLPQNADSHFDSQKYVAIHASKARAQEWPDIVIPVKKNLQTSMDRSTSHFGGEAQVPVPFGETETFRPASTFSDAAQKHPLQPHIIASRESHIRTHSYHQSSSLGQEYHWSSSMQENVEYGQQNGRARTHSDVTPPTHLFMGQSIRRTSLPVRRYSMNESMNHREGPAQGTVLDAGSPGHVYYSVTSSEYCH